jgi:hypothetical protein
MEEMSQCCAIDSTHREVTANRLGIIIKNKEEKYAHC